MASFYENLVNNKNSKNAVKNTIQGQLGYLQNQIPDWQSYQPMLNSMQTPDWRQAVSQIPNWQQQVNQIPNWQQQVNQIPDWRQMGRQVEETYNAANQVGLESARMGQESNQMAGMSNRGVLQPGFNPMRYWYAQKQAENNAQGLQARLGVESGLRGEALSTGQALRGEALTTGQALRGEALSTGQSLRNEGLQQLLSRYGIESGIRGENTGLLSMLMNYDTGQQQIAADKSAAKAKMWGDILGAAGMAFGLG